MNFNTASGQKGKHFRRVASLHMATHRDKNVDVNHIHQLTLTLPFPVPLGLFSATETIVLIVATDPYHRKEST